MKNLSKLATQISFPINLIYFRSKAEHQQRKALLSYPGLHNGRSLRQFLLARRQHGVSNQSAQNGESSFVLGLPGNQRGKSPKAIHE